MGEQLYEVLFTHAAIGVAVVSKERDFLKVNPRFCEMLGYSENELLSKNVSDVTHPDDMAENIRLDDEVLNQERKHFTFEKRYIKKDGNVFWILLTVSGYKCQTTGEPVFLAQVQDITPQKELEARNKQEALNALVVTYNHEINNALTGAYGAKISMDENGLTQESLRRLKESLDRITDIVAKISEASTQIPIRFEDYSRTTKMLRIKKGG